MAPVALPAAFGEASGGIHVTGSDEHGPHDTFTVLSSRGPLVFEVSIDGSPCSVRLDGVLGLVPAVDAVEQTRPPLSLGPATVTPPASEDDRFQAALQIAGPAGDPPVAPAGYRLDGPGIIHSADEVVHSPDPARWLHRLDEVWQRVMRGDRQYMSLTDSRVQLIATAALDAITQGAMADLHDDHAVPGQATSPADPPLALGDDEVASIGTGRAPDGRVEEERTLQWVHGPLLLAVTMVGPARSTGWDTVAGLAQNVEQLYRHSSFAA